MLLFVVEADWGEEPGGEAVEVEVELERACSGGVRVRPAPEAAAVTVPLELADDKVEDDELVERGNAGEPGRERDSVGGAGLEREWNATVGEMASRDEEGMAPFGRKRAGGEGRTKKGCLDVSSPPRTSSPPTIVSIELCRPRAPAPPVPVRCSSASTTLTGGYGSAFFSASDSGVDVTDDVPLLNVGEVEVSCRSGVESCEPETDPSEVMGVRGLRRGGNESFRL